MIPKTTIVLLIAAAAVCSAASRRWQTGTWGDVRVERRMIDFGPGSSGFGNPASPPPMRAMADVRRLVIETDDFRLELEDVVPVGRGSVDVIPGTEVTFALERKVIYVRSRGGKEHKLRVIRKVPL